MNWEGIIFQNGKLNGLQISYVFSDKNLYILNKNFGLCM
jgi:hypothetical protein